jgi:hypothetical protein
MHSLYMVVWVSAGVTVLLLLAITACCSTRSTTTKATGTKTTGTKPTTPGSHDDLAHRGLLSSGQRPTAEDDLAHMGLVPTDDDASKRVM